MINRTKCIHFTFNGQNSKSGKSVALSDGA